MYETLDESIHVDEIRFDHGDSGKNKIETIQ